MKKNTDWISIAKGLTSIAQLGLSVITPILLCALLGVFLKSKFGIPDFVVVILILLGVVSGISAAASFIRSFINQEQKKDPPKQLTPKSNTPSERR